MPKRTMGNQKAKDFKLAIKRLFKELHGFKKLIAIALTLAVLGSILTIFTPNILSDLTDTISDGLVVNKDNLEKISTDISSSLSGDKAKEVFAMDLSDKKMMLLMADSSINPKDLNEFQNIIKNMNSPSKLVEICGQKTAILENLKEMYKEARKHKATNPSTKSEEKKDAATTAATPPSSATTAT